MTASILTRPYRVRAFWYTALLSCVLVLVTGLSAQEYYGSIVGTVLDATGAAVPGATVTVTNKATNETRTGKSNSAGEFTFPDLLPSNYSVQVEGTGLNAMCGTRYP